MNKERGKNIYLLLAIGLSALFWVGLILTVV